MNTCNKDKFLESLEESELDVFGDALETCVEVEDELSRIDAKFLKGDCNNGDK